MGALSSASYCEGTLGFAIMGFGMPMKGDAAGIPAGMPPAMGWFGRRGFFS
jgi:hypothetical protein